MRFLLGRWRRIGSRLYLALGFSVLLTLLSSGVGVYHFEVGGDLGFRVRSESVPVLEAAWASALEAERLRSLGTAGGLSASPSGPVSVGESLEFLEARLAVVGSVPALAGDARAVQDAAYVVAGAVDSLLLDRAALAESDLAEAALRSRVEALPGSPAAAVLLRALSARAQPDLDRSWEAFSALPGAGVAPLSGLGGGPGGVFAVRGQRLSVESRSRALAPDFEEASLALDLAVKRMVEGAGRESGAALAAASGSFDQGRVLLAVISVSSVVLATLVAWLWVGNGMVRRLSRLSERMRRMAGGDLEMPVPEVGVDEIGELAQALEVFRQQALEVQRLNLVERLYGELQEANDELTRMQGRLVAQEKLAALGELVSGVAHEISNPLNFVKNFSEGSLDLYSELSEMLDGYRGVMSDGDAALLDEIGAELKDSLSRVQANGGRVLSIVERMRGLGVVGGEPVPADLNSVLRVAAAAACTSFETEWADFSVQPVFSLDSRVGMVPLITNDFAEAVKNLVSNACYAMRLRREALGPGEPYAPCLEVSSQGVDGAVEVRFRDNGTGIADDVLGRIFNPFFSTRDGVLGAGLGLPVAADVLRRAGGGLSVETVWGEFSEFLMELPSGGARVPAA